LSASDQAKLQALGATAQATAIAGVGANALVGGSNHSVAHSSRFQSRVRSDSMLLGGIGALDLHYRSDLAHLCHSFSCVFVLCRSTSSRLVSVCFLQDLLG